MIRWVVEAGEGASVSLDTSSCFYFSTSLAFLTCISPLSSTSFVLLASWQAHRIDQFLKYTLGPPEDSDEGLFCLCHAALRVVEPYGGGQKRPQPSGRQGPPPQGYRLKSLCRKRYEVPVGREMKMEKA